MLPVGMLMIEHRLIERMILLLEKRLLMQKNKSPIDKEFIPEALDFLKFYADRCHHGKEEEILFPRLRQKSLSYQDSAMLDELIDDHIRVRKLVNKMDSQFREKQSVDSGDVKILTDLYRSHVGKEDKRFFLPAMSYFNPEQKETMINDFKEFDRNLVHEKYRLIVEKLEKE